MTHLTAPNRLDREIRLLWLVELPILNDNKTLRDQLTVQMMQALYAPETQRQINIGLPNIDKPLDGAKTLKINWWHGISSRIASADTYIQEVQNLISSINPDPLVCEGVRVDILKQGTALDVNSIQGIVNGQRRAPTVDEMRGNLVYPTTVFVVTNVQDVTRLTEYELNKPARVPENLKEYREKASKYAGLVMRLRAEHDKINEEYIKATTSLNTILTNIQSAINQTDSQTANAPKRGWLARNFGANRQENKQSGQNQSNLISQAFTKAEEYYRLQAHVMALAYGLYNGLVNLDTKF